MKRVEKHLLSATFGMAALLQIGCATSATQVTGYAEHSVAQPFIQEMAKEGFDVAYLESLLNKAERKDSILKAISRPAEKRLNWGEYRNIFIQPKRIKRGVAFWREHASALKQAEKEYGVPAEFIVAIIGVETHYGRIMGKYRVLDALATLGFDYPKRSTFFRGQLKEYLLMVREEQIDPLSLTGSYAGAMGYGQFIPSSFRNYAVDFDGDGKRNIWTNPTDAIGSVANYFAKHGWVKGGSVVSPVVMNKQADGAWINSALKPSITIEQWAQRGVSAPKGVSLAQKATLMKLESAGQYRYLLGLQNFYVITRYNHSRLYAMAVYELSQAVKREHGDSER